MRNLVGAVVLLVLWSLAPQAHAVTLGVGSKLPELRLSDQHGVEATVGPDARFLVFTRDMDGGELVKEALAEDGSATLDRAKAVYVAEISRMPALVTRLFALPAMRKRGYRIVLDREGTSTAQLPSAQGKVTVMMLDAGKITKIEILDSAAAVRALLQTE
jgi:hypothetical protein